MKKKMLENLKEISDILMLDIPENEYLSIVKELEASIKSLSKISNDVDLEDFSFFESNNFSRLAIPRDVSSLRKDEIKPSNNIEELKSNIKDMKDGLVKV